MDKWRADWVKKKLIIASSLNKGELGGGYAEAIIILCAIISALSAEVWPGKSIDQKRFVELLKEFVNIVPSPKQISIPLLIGYLRDNSRVSEADRLQQNFLNFDETLVLTGTEVDKPENEVISLCNSLTLKEIRIYSYANVLYQEIRCNYMHEYNSGKKADPWPMTSNNQAQVSYVNWLDDQNRHIHFHFDWIAGLIAELATKVDEISEKIPLTIPTNWWIDG
jgi:hypothetical protein